jgi:hypothetical protein
VKVAEIVEATNFPPIVDDFTLDLTAGQLVEHTFVGTDPDGDALTWSLESFSGPGTPIFDAATHSVVWDLAGIGDGIYTVLATATDPLGLSDTGTLTIRISADGTLPEPPSPPQVDPSVIPLPLAAWSALSLLGGLGAAGKLRRRRDR